MPTTGKKISLYFHVPFCKKKCPYCHFYSIYHQEDLEKTYVKAIKKHVSIYKPVIKKNGIESIYFGGGTPSLLNIKTPRKILSELDFPKDMEITIEINPEDFSLKKIKAYKELNINRVSIGVQSFDERLLKLLKRRHSSLKAKEAIFAFYENGIENISIDLMYDIMTQNSASWEKTISEIKNLPITHISLYNLVFEKNTLFYKNKKKLTRLLPKEKESLSLLNTAAVRFEKLGFFRYEISAFAKKGYNSIHNTGYWTGRDFLGFGPSAFSYFNKKRFQNIPSLKKYFFALNNGLSPTGFEEKLKYPRDIHELLAINLRLIQGVDVHEFEKQFGAIPAETLKILKNSPLTTYKNNRIMLNKKGLLHYDTLAREII